MKKILHIVSALLLLITFGCKKEQDSLVAQVQNQPNIIKYAKGLEIYRHDGYSVVKVTNPWPEAQESFTYIMQQKGAILPDSLKKYTVVQVPVQKVVVTSTTHIPSLEMLGVEATLAGFPQTDYISSEKTRALVNTGKVTDVGANESLNTEVVIDLAPDAVVGFSISSNNKTMETLQQAGLNVLYNGDWTEQTPLGKAEWIKFFGALYDLDDKSDSLFAQIEKDYKEAQQLAQKVKHKPTVLCGALYRDQWYLPQGGSWAALFLSDAGADYLWKHEKGTGSLGLSFETVLDRAANADVWIGPSEYTSLNQMVDSNPHYKQFKAFRNGEVYSFSSKKGEKGGLLYYELAPNRPDLVLKDLISILHPELLPGYQLHFFEKLK